MIIINNFNENLSNEGIEIAKKFKVNPDNIFIHSTTFDGFYDLYIKRYKGDYLSVSSFNSSKFIEKGFGTIYILLHADDNQIDFREWGDVGWKGGSPRKTSYDEIGLTNWKILAFYIPPYYNNEKNLYGRTVLAQTEYNYNLDENYSIITKNKKLVNNINNEIQEYFIQKENEGINLNNKSEYKEIIEELLNIYRS